MLSAVQPAGAPPPVAFAAPQITATGPRAVAHELPKLQQQQLQTPPQTTQFPGPLESKPLDPQQAAQANGTRPQPIAWVLPGNKPTQPPSKGAVQGGGRMGRQAPAARQSQSVTQRPGTSNAAAMPVQAVSLGRLNSMLCILQNFLLRSEKSLKCCSDCMFHLSAGVARAKVEPAFECCGLRCGWHTYEISSIGQTPWSLMALSHCPA